MFFENEYVRPLFDNTEGGPPKAFMCICLEFSQFDPGDGSVHCAYKSCSNFPHPPHISKNKCGKICITEEGMKRHLQQVHKWEEQPCLSSMVQCKTEQGVPRKLRAGAPILNQNGGEKNTEKIQPNQKLTETKEGELQMPTKKVKSDSKQLTLTGLNSATVENPTVSGVESTTTEDRKTVTSPDSDTVGTETNLEGLS